MDEQTVQLLQDITENAEMGKGSVQHLLQVTDNPSLRHHLQKQLNTYDDLLRRAKAMLAVEGAMPKEQSPMTKAWVSMGIHMKTMADHSPRNLAEMLIEGNHMGATDMVKAMRDAHGANDGARALAQRLHDAEEQYAQELTTFL